VSRGLSRKDAAERYERERRQGAEIAASGLERVWGWSSPAGKIRAARRAAFLAEAAGLRPGVRCLEIGAGTGEFTARLLDTGSVLTALELSDATGEICRARVNGRAEIVIGNIETGEGLAGRTFDAVVGVSILHHVNLDLTLATIARVLEPGGRFAFSEPNMANPQVWAERAIRLVGRLRHTTEHETAFRPRQLREAFERHGFVVDESRSFDFVHPATPRVALPAVIRLGEMLERTPVREIAGSVLIAGSAPALAKAS
jgi:SAM-dependent methyltransferase